MRIVFMHQRQVETQMPDRKTLERARKDRQQGKRAFEHATSRRSVMLAEHRQVTPMEVRPARTAFASCPRLMSAEAKRVSTGQAKRDLRNEASDALPVLS